MSLLKKRGIVVANCVVQGASAYNNNRYIRELGEVPTLEQVIESMEFIPQVLEEERYLEKGIRIKKLNKIDYYHCTTEVDIMAESCISEILREGYKYRYGEEIDDVASEEYQYRNRYVARALGIFAKSGCGKTTLIDKIQLMNYEGIIHLPDTSSNKSSDDRRNYTVQIPIVKINVPANCTPKNICIRILEEVDRICEGLEKYREIGQANNESTKKKNYTSRNRFPNVDDLFRYTKGVIRNNAIGVIILDEIHNIRYLNRKEHNTILNFFVELSNELKVPLVFVGTEEALPLFMEKFQNGRRLCTEPPIIFEGIKEGIEWEVFLNNLFTIQLIQKPLKFGEKISNFLYEMSHGIPDIVIKVFKEAQKIAIKSEKECMDEEVFIRAYRSLFPFLDDELIDMDNRANIIVDYRLNINNKKQRGKKKNLLQRHEEENNKKGKRVTDMKSDDVVDNDMEAFVKVEDNIITTTSLIDIYNEIPKEERREKNSIYKALQDNGYIADMNEFLD